MNKYNNHLKKQLGFLVNSCNSYDQGFIDEAIRMATIIRVLIHNTRNSTSLLKHLNATHIKLLSSCDTMPISTSTIFYFGLGLFSTKHGYKPSLDDIHRKSMISVNDWWNQIVYVLEDSTRLTRKGIILTAANKDGGAHVDQNLTPEYEKLATDGALGIYSFKIAGNIYNRPVTDAHLVAIRQMGHEIINSPELTNLIKIDSNSNRKDTIMSKGNKEKTKLSDIENGDKLEELIKLLPFILELEKEKNTLLDNTPPDDSIVASATLDK